MITLVYVDNQYYARMPLRKIKVCREFGLIRILYHSAVYSNGTLSLQHVYQSFGTLPIGRNNVQRLISPILYAYIRNLTCSSDLKNLYILHDTACSTETEPVQCPICFGDHDASQMLVTNCSHRFCLDCMKDYAGSIKNNTSKPTCPYCRAIIVEVKSTELATCRSFSHYVCTL